MLALVNNNTNGLSALEEWKNFGHKNFSTEVKNHRFQQLSSMGHKRNEMFCEIWHAFLLIRMHSQCDGILNITMISNLTLTTLTALLWFQKMNAGGSGELFTTHVRFIVDPLSMYKSGPPIISVDGSAI